MKVLSLTQPWATFVALGRKTVETRSWATDYRGPLAIHATLERCDPRAAAELWIRSGGTALDLATRLDRGRRVPAFPSEPYPRGAVLCVVDLVDVVRVAACRTDAGEIVGHDGRTRTLAPAEFVLGDLSTGRIAWLTSNLRVPRTPVPCRGAQGLRDLAPAVARAVAEAPLVEAEAPLEVWSDF